MIPRPCADRNSDRRRGVDTVHHRLHATSSVSEFSTGTLDPVERTAIRGSRTLPRARSFGSGPSRCSDCSSGRPRNRITRQRTFAFSRSGIGHFSASAADGAASPEPLESSSTSSTLTSKRSLAIHAHVPTLTFWPPAQAISASSSPDSQSLHNSGKLSDDEYAAAKRYVLGQ